MRSDGYTKPKDEDGVWKGGVDLVAQLDPTLSPEVQYIALLEDQGLVVTSDSPQLCRPPLPKSPRATATRWRPVDGVTDMARQVGDPANAMLWTGDFACDDLAMSSADQDDQEQGARARPRGGQA